MLKTILIFCCACAFICGVVLPLFRLLKKEEEKDDEAILRFELMINTEQQQPGLELGLGLGLGLELADNNGIDVHDHTVQASLVKSFEKLKETATFVSSTSFKEEIKKAIFEYAKRDVDVSERAYSTLRTMIKYNGRLSSIDTDELTVLEMVWSRIHDPVNAKVLDDLKDSLICQLAEASMTLDLSRCLSGRVARVIQSLEAIDAENVVNIASTEDIRRELSDKVPLLINNYYENGATDEDEDEDETEAKIRDFVDNELRKDYVLTNLLTETEYVKITKDYLDAIINI